MGDTLKKSNGLTPNLTYGFRMTSCSVRRDAFRGSQVRPARNANASINAGCGGVGFIGPGPMGAATAEKAICTKGSLIRKEKIDERS